MESKDAAPPATSCLAHAACLLLTTRPPTQATAVVEHITSQGGRAVAIGGDVTDPQFPQHAVKETLQAFGGLHILVNNAGTACSAQVRKRFTDPAPPAPPVAAQPALLCQSGRRVSPPGSPACWHAPARLALSNPQALSDKRLVSLTATRPQLLANARPGYTWDGVVHRITDEQWQAMLDVHCTAPFRLIQVRLGGPCTKVASRRG